MVGAAPDKAVREDIGLVPVLRHTGMRSDPGWKIPGQPDKFFASGNFCRILRLPPRGGCSKSGTKGWTGLTGFCLTLITRHFSNATLTSAITGGAFQIMGDKSPKANQKQKAQQKAKASSASQKKHTAAAAKAAPKKK